MTRLKFTYRNIFPFFFLLILFVSAFPAVASSVAVSDTTAVGDSVRKTSSKRFDAWEYSMQKRFRPSDHSAFVVESFLDNSFVSITGSAFRILGSRDYSSGPVLGASYGKWFTPLHGARVSVDLGYWKDNYDARNIKEFSLKLSYLFNFMSYIWGYDTSRFCEISAVAGPGYSFSWRNGNHGSAFSSHLGLNVNLRLFDHFDLYIEPLYEIYTGSYSLSYKGTWKKAVSSFNGKVGLSYKFGQPNTNEGTDPADIAKRWYLFVSGGVQFQNSKMVFSEVKFPDALGMHINFGAGRWYTDAFAIRFSAAYSDCKWIKYYASAPLPAYYVSLRLEGQLDIVRLVTKNTNPRASLSVLFGPEAGHITKKDLNSRIREHYVGCSGGLQGILRITHGVSVFFEPRFSIVPYSAPSNDRTVVNKNRNYYDALLNFNIGLQYDL